MKHCRRLYAEATTVFVSHNSNQRNEVPAHKKKPIDPKHLRDFTPEDVVKAYEETGMKPAAFLFARRRGKPDCGCGLAALSKHRGAKRATSHFDGMHRVLKHANIKIDSIVQADAWANGFDQAMTGRPMTTTSAWSTGLASMLSKGYDAGLAVKRKLAEA